MKPYASQSTQTQLAAVRSTAGSEGKTTNRKTIDDYQSGGENLKAWLSSTKIGQN